jgi:titin
VTDIQRDSIAVSWQVPESDGGVPITNYYIEKHDKTRSSWSSAGKVKPSELVFTVGKLIEGNEYYIRVIAENEIGQSEPCELKDPVKAKSPFDVPGPPLNLRPTDITKKSCSLAWKEPVADGGSKIKGYIIERSQGYGGRWVKVNRTPVTELSYDVTDLIENQEYEFRVLAENAEGVGAPSQSVGPFKAKEAFGKFYIYFILLLKNILNIN